MKKHLITLFLFILFATPISTGQTYDFVTCGQNGRHGPSQSDCDPYYSGDNNVNVVGSGIQEWEVPRSGKYRITAYGPSGLNQNPNEAGKGAVIQAEFNFNQGETLQIIVGQQSSYSGSRDWFGGSGGTYIVDSSDTPLIIAGGGAGHRTDSYTSQMRANTGTSGEDGMTGYGGTNGNGGTNDDMSQWGGNYQAGGGSGWETPGDPSPDNRYDNTINSETFLQGGLGGYHQGGDGLTNDGGFGGGGAAGWGDSGGAGGYSGGGPNADGYYDGWGGGGGSFIHSSASDASTSDGSFSTTGSEPHSTYGGNVEDLNNWRRGAGRVEITALTNPDDPVIQNLNFNREPGNPASIDGSFDVNIDDDDGNAPSNELESCTVAAEGQDNGGQVDLTTNVNGNSCSFSVNNNDNGNWNPDEELSFDISVEDSYSGTDSLTSFREFIVNPPNAPDNVAPSDGSSTVGINKDLEVTATHPDGIDMDVTFYLDDGSGFSQVGSTQTVSDGNQVSVSPSLDEGTQYEWYAEADTQGRTNESSRWQFTTNYEPEIQQVESDAKASDHNLSVSSEVIDEDGRGQLDSCELEVSGNGETETYSGTFENGDSPNEAICRINSVGYRDGSSWNHLQNLNLDLTVEDDKGLSDSDSAEATLPNHKPVIEDTDVVEYDDREAFRVESRIRAGDLDVSELNDCSILISDEDNSVTAGQMTQINSTHVRCNADNIGSQRFPNLNLKDEIDVDVRINDIHGESNSDSVVYNLPTGIDSEYSSIVINSGGLDFVEYQISNSGEGEAEYRTELYNLNSSFTENENDVFTETLDSGESTTVRIRVSPDVGFTGKRELRVVTENLETGVMQNSSISVLVRETPRTTERQVPGIGLVQLLVLIFTALAVFYRV